MTRHLIVANQTLGGRVLERHITQRLHRGDADFYVLVPMVEVEHEANTWAASDPMFGMPAQLGSSADAVDRARRRSRHRLDAMIDKIERLGGTAEGEVGDPDPARAVQDLLDREQFDEIIVSTLPAGLSRWLKMDLPSRVDRMTDTPVVTVEAEAS